MPGNHRPNSGSCAYHSASRRSPSSMRHGRRPPQIARRWPRVEPVGGSQLLGEEPGERRLVGTAQQRPDPFDDGPDPRRRRRGARRAARIRRRRPHRCRRSGHGSAAAHRWRSRTRVRRMPRRGAPHRAPRRARSRRCRCTSCRRGRRRRRPAASRPARARSTMRPTSCVSPGPHTRCGRITTTAMSSDVAASAPRSRRSPSTRRSTPAGDRAPEDPRPHR